MATLTHPPQSILRTSRMTCSSASCRASNSMKRVSFASDLTSSVPQRSRVSPPSTRHHRRHHRHHNEADNEHHRRRHHRRHHGDDKGDDDDRHHRHHRRCKKRGSRKHRSHHEPRTRRSIVQLSELSARRQRKRDAGVTKMRTSLEKRRSGTASPLKHQVLASSVISRGAVEKKNQVTFSYEPTSTAKVSAVSNREKLVSSVATVSAMSEGSRAASTGEDNATEVSSQKSNKEDSCRLLKHCKPSDEDILKCTRRSIARLLQLSREGLSDSALKPVDARTLYELYMKISGGGEDTGKNKALKNRLEAQEKRDGRRRGSRKQRKALAELVATELGREVEGMVKMPRRKLVEKYVVNAAAARMERLTMRQVSGRTCRRRSG